MEHIKKKYQLNPRNDILDGNSHQFGVNVWYSGEYIFHKIHCECLLVFTMPHLFVGGT
jgi:hypothetical protein